MARRFLLPALLLLAGGPARAADPPPTQPRPAQPTQPRAPAAPAATVQQLEEDVELLEAQLDGKRARVKMAEAMLARARAQADRLMNLRDKGIVPADELTTAKYDVEVLAAELEVRKAEQKEVEVKLKYAKKRLENAKAR